MDARTRWPATAELWSVAYFQHRNGSAIARDLTGLGFEGGQALARLLNRGLVHLVGRRYAARAFVLSPEGEAVLTAASARIGEHLGLASAPA